MSSVSLKEEVSFRVLVVDDDLTILGLLKELITLVPGCEVFTASRPDEAMKLAVQNHIDIIFTDVHMPGVTGIEMVRDLIALQHTPEVIVMTAYPSGEVAQQAMELGAASLLSKPFEDISVVEIELDKCIKKLLRQRAAAPEVEEAKKILAAKSSGEVDSDPAMRVSLDHLGAAVAENQSERPVSDVVKKLPSKRIYDLSLVRPLVEIESHRSRRYNRPFTMGVVELPLYAGNDSEGRLKDRDERLQKILSICRSSDVVMPLEGDEYLILGFECNRTGANVVQFKLQQAGFAFTGFSVFPTEAQDFDQLLRTARNQLNEKRKFRILFLEPEEFFGRIVANMLNDPKYQVDWVKNLDEAHPKILDQAENIKLMIISLSKDPKQWELLAKLKKEKLSTFPILMFTEVALTDRLKTQLHGLGVKAVVRKGAGHEEFLYVVQSFVMQASAIVARRNPRALVTVPITYQAEGQAEVATNTFTLSREGIFIRELNPLGSSSRLKLSLMVPGHPGSIPLSGEVIYSVPYFVGVNRIHVPGMAVKFDSLDPKSLEILDRFISSSLTSYILA